MTDDPNRLRQAEERLDEPHGPESTGRTPGGLTWPIRRFYWAFEKHFLWRISDSFKRITRTMRYRSPLAYVAATMLVMMTLAAGGAAFYFYNEAESTKETSTIAEVPAAETIVAPTTPVPTTPVTPPSDAKPDDTLKGVVPDFDTASGNSKDSSGKKSDALDPAATVVKPAATPDSPPLKVAHNFAQTFVDYEIGRKGAVKDFEKTATVKLTRELKKSPPRQPSNGDIPRATVMNVVKGEKDGDTMDVSVSLLRSGATSELRLELDQAKGKKWLVSEVRG